MTRVATLRAVHNQFPQVVEAEGRSRRRAQMDALRSTSAITLT
jgi:hypothetical protein